MCRRRPVVKPPSERSACRRAMRGVAVEPVAVEPIAVEPVAVEPKSPRLVRVAAPVSLRDRPGNCRIAGRKR